jgi:hypothetical protein
VNALLIVLAALGGAGLLPALVLARRSPVLVFLAPLIGACMAAVGAEFELGVGGSLRTCFIAVAAAVNTIAVVWWLVAGRLRRWPSPPWWWSLVAVIVVLGALTYPLLGLRGQLVGGRDPNTIWLTHALMISGGHHQLLAALRNPVYQFTNPDYPPLVPAAGALAFAYLGRGDLYVAIDMTEYMNAAALGVLATGIALAARRAGVVANALAILAGGAIAVVGFAVAGRPGIDGYADLLWAAAAAAAIIWGLVLPQSPQALVISWLCAVTASLTKNEGLTTSLIIIVLVALRYRPLRRPRWSQRQGRRVTVLRTARRWAERGALVAVPALPGLTWAWQIRGLGLHNAFFVTSGLESLSVRASHAASGIAGHLTVAPVAFGVLIAGSLIMRADRRRAGLANPAWLWLACLGSLLVIFGTYVFGGLEIDSWLQASVSRTTIFAQLLLYADLAVWLVLAADVAAARARTAAATPAALPLPT